MPRDLNEPACCSCSSLRTTAPTPVRSVERTGVRRTSPVMRVAAASTSSRLLTRPRYAGRRCRGAERGIGGMPRPPSPSPVSLRQRLRQGPPLIVTFSIVASPEIVELAGLAGFDVVVLDMEHGAYEIANLGPHILAARASGIAPIVRV